MKCRQRGTFYFIKKSPLVCRNINNNHLLTSRQRLKLLLVVSYKLLCVGVSFKTNTETF